MCYPWPHWASRPASDWLNSVHTGLWWSAWLSDITSNSRTRCLPKDHKHTWISRCDSASPVGAADQQDEWRTKSIKTSTNTSESLKAIHPHHKQGWALTFDPFSSICAHRTEVMSRNWSSFSCFLSSQLLPSRGGVTSAPLSGFGSSFHHQINCEAFDLRGNIISHCVWLPQPHLNSVRLSRVCHRHKHKRGRSRGGGDRLKEQWKSAHVSKKGRFTSKARVEEDFL